jgi:hypothetical protein
VTVPKSVKIVGPHISCPPSFVYGKELASVEAGPKDVLCTYGDSLKCFYNPKTGKKMGKSSKGASLNWVAGCGSSWPGCPASTAKSTGCGSLCYTGCPAKTDSGAKWDGMDLFWEKDPADGDGSSILLSCCTSRSHRRQSRSTHSRAAYGVTSCYYYLETGNAAVNEDNDADCPAKSAAKPEYCLLR